MRLIDKWPVDGRAHVMIEIEPRAFLITGMNVPVAVSLKNVFFNSITLMEVVALIVRP
jgi:hypothetical protein